MYVYANETLNDVSYLLTDLSGTSAMRPETKELTKEAILRPHKKCSYMHHPMLIASVLDCGFLVDVEG
jgi:hypothetical protein